MSYSNQLACLFLFTVVFPISGSFAFVPKKVVRIVGIAGGTGSGKTTLARAMESELKARTSQVICSLSQDSYYSPADIFPADLRLTHPEEMRGEKNFDHPRSIHFDYLTEQLQDLSQGKSVQVPTYDFVISDRKPDVEELGPCDWVILEGLHILYHAKMRDLLDYKVFVDLDDSTRFERRVRRDLSERGRELESVHRAYTFVARPMYFEFIEPTREFADRVISGAFNKEDVRQLVDDLLENRDRSK